MKTYSKKTRIIKKIALIICIYMAIRAISSFFYLSYKDKEQHWTLTNYCCILENPYFVWEGTLYYHGKDAPKTITVRLNGDNIHDSDYSYEVTDFGVIDESSSTTNNVIRIIYNILSGSMPSFHGYNFMNEGIKLEKACIYIEWEENNSKHISTINIDK